MVWTPAKTMAADDDNPYCRALDIPIPRVEDVVGCREANNFGLLVTALLERGGPMTLEEVARRFEEAGVASSERALRSLHRSRPATRPIHRDGDLYELDPHDSEAHLWVVRLDLRRKPEKASKAPVQVEPMPGPETALTLDEIDDAFGGDANLRSWSAQRLVLAILDAHGEPRSPERVVADLSARTKYHGLRADTISFERRNAAVRLDGDGRWAIVDGHDALRSAREAVRARIERARASAAQRTDPEVLAARREEYKAKCTAEVAWLAAASHAIIHAFPPEDPVAVVLANLDTNVTELFVKDGFGELCERLVDFDVIAGIDVRALLRKLGFEPGERRLRDLGPPQKTRKFGKRGRPIELTTTLMIRSSCGLERPLTPETTLTKYLRAGDFARLRNRLESDLRSLRALYEYGRLHDAVRLRWRQYDEMHPLGWSSHLENELGRMCREAMEMGRDLEVVLEAITDWNQPWAQSEIVFVEQGMRPWSTVLVDELGREFDKDDVQLARFADDVDHCVSSGPPQLTLVPDEPALAPERPKPPSRPPTGLAQVFVGKWRITDMQRWGPEYYDMDGPAHIILRSAPGEPNTARGQLRFGLIWGELDGRCEMEESGPILRFSWMGDDEGEPVSGRGWLSMTPTEMRGQIFIHLGDDSTFAARRR